MLRQSAHVRRFFATSAISRNSSSSSSSSKSSSLYAFKSQLDDYIYYHSLSSQWRPLVYRQRNAEVLTSLNAVDKKNNPLTPRQYPGVPSKKKLIKFISLLLTAEEVKLVRSSLEELSKIRISSKTRKGSTKKDSNKGKYLDPSVLNEFLYKSYELDSKLFTENLVWADQIREEDSVWSVKNTEAVAFVRSMIIKTSFPANPEVNFQTMVEKMKHWAAKAEMSETGSILYNASLVVASVYSNSLKENSTALNHLDALTKNKVYTVKPQTDYLQYDHAYSIISALKDASKHEYAENNAQLLELVSRWSTFLADVENLKQNTPSTYERFLSAEEGKRAAAATATAGAAAEPAPEQESADAAKAQQ
ncbi:hypothetical protein PICMEDRAFT_71804 [Pichia membranifaciens NRRL Y-2026]|uniref:Uncharacterized protein n=1 Tax=Pichia membranifaciens NRRL Y-2026 TaxID=763406 RepID=A0A1E3NNW9_9ASCO|nr:hypothetical protein PICMEDRAFT_71804 [Pichia membranifaciens NRRL Y-2026]ODQ47772.1 hypothetical protein PICMEDRAFT_71804 [Pichia membranifaciens NRRL Y-2026]